jgi:hypothetical protein
VQFTATGSPVSWSVQVGAVGGSITNTGLYTAPVNLGTFHIVATSLADSTRTATATITIVPAVIVFPTSDTLGPAGLRGFGVDVNPPVPSVTWTILEGPAGGSMSGNNYTAPEDIGTYHLVATSTLDSRLSFTVPITVVPHGFLPVGDLNLPRMGHTATLLPNGMVLIAGGDPCWVDDGVCPLEETELFVPSSDVFVNAANMLAQRAFHRATLMSDGKVLLTGGSSPTSELYDPATGAFALTGSLSVNRSGHTATLLADGRVLIAGGQTITTPISSAELYDPQTGTFSTAAGGGLIGPRSEHTATRLPNGQVLITGGFNPVNSAESLPIALSTAELYDPLTETFIATGNMTQARGAHTATLLGNGTVLITGGLGAFDTAEIYDPASGRFSTTGTMLMGRYAHIAIELPNGMVLVTGGDNLEIDGQLHLGFTAELYDPATGGFTQTGSMRAGHRILSAAVLLDDGRVLLTGALEGATAEVYQ